MTEEQFLQNVRALAHARGWLTYHTRDSRRSDAGFVDLVMVRQGRLVFAELKRERALLKNGAPSAAATFYPTAAQWAWLDALRGVAAATDHAVSACLWRPSSWPEIEAVLR